MPTGGGTDIVDVVNGGGTDCAADNDKVDEFVFAGNVTGDRIDDVFVFAGNVTGDLIDVVVAGGRVDLAVAIVGLGFTDFAGAVVTDAGGGIEFVAST